MSFCFYTLKFLVFCGRRLLGSEGFTVAAVGGGEDLFGSIGERV